MAKEVKDTETEELIKATAKRLFFEEGRFKATTQEIADAAGVNRTLINYYFRSRDNLFDLIFEDAIKRVDKLREEVLFSEKPFKEKMEKYLEDSLVQAKEYPYLESYIVSRMNDGYFYKNEEEFDRFISQFYKEYEREVKKGNLVEMEPVQFLLNIASLISFPQAARPLFQSSMRLTDAEFEEIMEGRKEAIMKILFKK